MKGVNLIVKLRNQLIEGLLECLHAAFLLAFNCGNNLGKLTDLLDAFSKVISVLLFNFKLELSKSVVDLTEEIDSIPNILEVLICVK